MDYKTFEFRKDGDSPDYFLWRLYSDWQRRKNAIIAEFDLTGPQMTLLTSIYWLIQNGRETIQATIADTANMDRMNTSSVLRTLQKKGLVIRKEHETDTRAKTAVLTPKGIEITVNALRLVNQHNTAYFSPLGTSRELFIKLLQQTLHSNKMQKHHQSTYQTIVKAPVEKVWKALVDANLVKQYFFGSNQETDWKVGSPIVWTGEFEGASYTDKGVVQDYKHNQTLTYSYLSSWANLEDKPENYLVVTYAVKPVANGTELTIIQSNYDEEKAKHSSENWEMVISGLKKLVE